MRRSCLTPAVVALAILITSRKRSRLLRLLDMIKTAWCRRHDYTIAQVDVFSGYSFLWAEAVCQIFSWLGKPYILTLHGGNLPMFAKKWPGRVRRLLCSAAVVTTPSGYLLHNMTRYRSDLRLLPNPWISALTSLDCVSNSDLLWFGCARSIPYTIRHSLLGF